jgi:hypothetical protein
VLGKLPPLLVEVPWWPEVACLVRAARRLHGVDVTVLRMLRAERDEPPGGLVTYLAEARGPVRCEPCDFPLEDHPLAQQLCETGRAQARPGLGDGNHEGALIAALDKYGCVPPLFGHERCRTLMRKSRASMASTPR